ncbi:MAG: hypothetical protein Q4G33_13815 [bacterium]|nr:hypothetical protein [bacterium]
MKDLEMMESRINDLWNNGYSEELTYFAHKCINAYKKGSKKGACMGFIIGSMIGCAVDYIIIYHIHRKKVKTTLNEVA